jgi:uncharacterized protein (UPF0333 family)
MSTTRFPTRQRGQGMTEYIIIVILVAVAAIGVYMYFGKTVREDVAGMSQEMAGQSSSTAQQQAKEAANQGQTEANKDKGLGSYSNPQGGN